MTLSGFSLTQHSGDQVIFGREKPNHSGNLVSGSRVIFGRKWPYHFGRKRPWPHQKTILRRKHCVKTLCGLGDKVHLRVHTKTFFQYIWKTEKSFLFHKSKKNKKKRSIRLFVPNKRKNEKKKLHPPFHYSTLTELQPVELFTTRCFRNGNAYATLFSRLSFFWVWIQFARLMVSCRLL